MKILFLQDNAINESLALTELSGFLKANGHVCELLIEREEKNLIESIDKISPDIFLIPCSLYAHKWVLNVAKNVKEHWDKPIVLGGTHATFFPEIILDKNIDIVCRGEAEGAILELLNKLEKGESIKRIKNLWVKTEDNIYKNDLRNLVENLDSFPLPDRELYYKYSFIKNITTKRFASGRGCVNNCSFCLNPILRKQYANKGSYVRKKSCERVISEIAEIIIRKHPLKSVHFSDDIFVSDKKWLEKFVKLYKKEINLPFTCNSSAEFLDEDIVKMLKAGGCRGVAIGLETGRESLRMMILGKKVTNEDIEKAAMLVKKYGMKLTTFNMLALPGETIEDAFETIKLNHKIKADYTRITLTLPLPNTALMEYSKKEGFFDPRNDNIDYCTCLLLEKFSAVFKSKYKNEFNNLIHLFRITAKFPILFNLAKKIIKLPNSRIFFAADIAAPYFEKKMLNVSWLSGFIYFLHVGDPGRRTTNFTTLI